MESSRSGRPGLTPTKLAYYAGFLDGEGSFGYYDNRIRVCAVNTYLPIIRELASAFGGSWRMRKSDRENTRVTYEWQAYGDAAREACVLLYPHLVEKQRQAGLLLEIGRYPKGSARVVALERELKKLKRIQYG